MSVLVIQIPPRTRLAARSAAADGAAAERPVGEFDYLLTADGQTVAARGRAAPALLPRASSVVAVLAGQDVAWHAVTVPKAPPARLRAALAGVMEEALLDDDEALHFALGAAGWVAVLHKRWLLATLAELEKAGLPVDRVVAPGAPADAPRGHFFTEALDGEAEPWLAWSDARGAACLRLNGSLARSRLPAPDAEAPARWTATPAAATAAEAWLGAPVTVVDDDERLLAAARDGVNLRQFDLAPRRRGTLALRDAWAGLRSPAWRPVRVGLVTLVVLQLVAINLMAWQQRRALAGQQLAMVELLRSTHPQVRAVLDAPLQMEREGERLRAAAGRPGDTDLEVLLAAAAAAWPDGHGPVQTLRFEAGRLVLAAPGWNEQQVAAFRARLRPSGFDAELSEGRLTLTRAAGPGGAA